MKVFREIGASFLFLTQIFNILARSRIDTSAVFSQIFLITTRSLVTVCFAGLFVGAILTLQFDLILANYDARSILGGLNTSAIIRAVGPLMISFLLAGKIGAFTTAELGTMRVTHQIDAIECLGISALAYLVVPRFLAIIFSSLILLTIGLIVSIMGSMLIAQVCSGINFLQFAASIPRFTSAWTLFAAAAQSTLYGFIVATVSCQRGYLASGGARGVGRAVTLASVSINFYIILANYISSQFLALLEKVLK